MCKPTGYYKTLLQSQLRICEVVPYLAKDHWDHADWIVALSDSWRQKFDLNNNSGSSSISSNASIYIFHNTTAMSLSSEIITYCFQLCSPIMQIWMTSCAA
ncbi:hypothetical protein V1520DRAFT_349005 [Lipomyces starkeyi]|uniref:Uncharacterized protein n=1 Tax=Lipomyces starkeyi NRRL Y-11557 TaxID=675824 RepID=A0A1E3Q2G0_LIPST|nr:hypothetical protein LIPSTDRAFT_331621 [Lipomyces starkeyi NRRL Y-11557]